MPSRTIYEGMQFGVGDIEMPGGIKGRILEVVDPGTGDSIGFPLPVEEATQLGSLLAGAGKLQVVGEMPPDLPTDPPVAA